MDMKNTADAAAAALTEQKGKAKTGRKDATKKHATPAAPKAAAAKVRKRVVVHPDITATVNPATPLLSVNSLKIKQRCDLLLSTTTPLRTHTYLPLPDFCKPDKPGADKTATWQALSEAEMKLLQRNFSWIVDSAENLGQDLERIHGMDAKEIAQAAVYLERLRVHPDTATADEERSLALAVDSCVPAYADEWVRQSCPAGTAQTIVDKAQRARAAAAAARSSRGAEDLGNTVCQATVTDATAVWYHVFLRSTADCNRYPLTHIVSKVAPRACARRKMEDIVKSLMTSNASVSSIVFEWLLCSLLNGYDHGTPEFSPTLEQRVFLYGVLTESVPLPPQLMANGLLCPVDKWPAELARWRSTLRSDLVLNCGNLLAFVVREQLVAVIDSDEPSRAVLDGLIDYAVFRSRIISVMNAVRKYVYSQLVPTGTMSYANCVHRVADSFSFKPYETWLTRVTRLAHSRMVLQGYRKPPISFAAHLKDLRGQVRVDAAYWRNVDEYKNWILQFDKPVRVAVPQTAAAASASASAAGDSKSLQLSDGKQDKESAPKKNQDEAADDKEPEVLDDGVDALAHAFEVGLSAVDESSLLRAAEDIADAVPDVTGTAVKSGLLFDAVDEVRRQLEQKMAFDAESARVTDVHRLGQQTDASSRQLVVSDNKISRAHSRWIEHEVLGQTGVDSHPDRMIEAMLPRLVCAGASRDALLRMGELFNQFRVDSPSRKQWIAMLTGFRQQWPYSYNLVQATTDFVVQSTALSRYALPEPWVRGQLMAMRESYGGGMRDLVEHACQFWFCSVCWRVYSTTVFFTADSHKFEHKFGFSDVLVSYPGRETFCRRAMCFAHNHCQDRELSKVSIFGSMLVFKHTLRMLCPQRACLRHMLYNPALSEVNERGPACAKCTVRIIQERKVQHLPALLVDPTHPCRHCFRCGTVDRLDKNGRPIKPRGSMFYVAADLALCAKHNQRGLVAYIEEQIGNENTIADIMANGDRRGKVRALVYAFNEVTKARELEATKRLNAVFRSRFNSQNQRILKAMHRTY